MNDEPILYDQISNAPTRKMLYNGLYGILSYLVLLVSTRFGVTLPPEAMAAIPVAAGWLAGYFYRSDILD